MKTTDFLTFLTSIEPLKSCVRHCYTSAGLQETVAGHSWRMAMMAMLLREEFAELDMDRVVDMCLIHDLGEAVTGDIPTFVKTRGNERTEAEALDQLMAALPEPQRGRLTALFAEMEGMKTKEARLYKALDKLEAVIQHNESDLATWIPLEYELNKTYGTENAAEFPFLAELRAQVRLDTEEKIAKGVLAEADAH